MFIDHDEGRFFVASFGSGERTLVAVGGWTGSWEVWADVFGCIGPGWRTVGIDHRGTGATIAETTGVTIQQMANDLLAILDKLGIEECILAAESSGAAAALSAVYQQPDRFQGLVLSGGFYYRPENDDPGPFLAGLRTDYEATVDYFIAQCLPETNDPAIHQWARKILLRASQTAAIDLYKTTLKLDLRPIVSRIAVKTLLFHGDADRILPVDSSHWLSSQMPNSHLEIIPGAGHAPMMTFPETIASAVNRFFNQAGEI